MKTNTGCGDVVSGRKRQQINAIGSGIVSETTTGVDNADHSRVAATAEQNNFILREGLTTMQKQLDGRREYIKEESFKIDRQDVLL
ncbi:lysis system i-spanin subunit Rz [Cronobacter malonaticus]|nr:lysis protein [Cronobacter malonaticus]